MPEGLFRVLIVGCGELGTRHLQAVSTLPCIGEIEVVDPRPEGLALGRQRLAAVADRAPGIVFRWLSALDQTSAGGDLCIVATQSKGRCDVVRRVAEVAGYRSFLIEKLVARSTVEYESLLAFATAHRLDIWVNCKRRAYPISKRIKALIDPAEPILVTEAGGQHGLANNGIHSVDLFVFYDQCRRLDSAGSRIIPTLYPSKRGPDVFDLAGTLCAQSEKGSQVTLMFAGDHLAPPVMTIVSPRYRWIVDEMSRNAWESDSETGWQWRPVPFEGELMVSVMTRRFATDILNSGTCELPTLADCLPAHRFVLDELMPHFRRLVEPQLDHCPVA